MINSYSIFIVGGTFKTVGKKKFAQRRSWEMLRIFADQMSNPVFGMYMESDDPTLQYPLPDEIHITEVVSSKMVGMSFKTILGCGLTDTVRRQIDNSYAVYLRLPLLICWDVFKYARRKNKRIIASFHGDWVEGYKKRKGGLFKKCLLYAAAWHAENINRKIARECDLLLCVGQRLTDQYGGLAKHVVTFANFLHIKDDIACPRSLCEKPPYKLLYVGELEQRKGVAYLIDAVELLGKRGIEVELTIVGAGPEESLLRTRIALKGISNKVKMHNYVEYGSGLMNFYRCADMFVLPSISSEGVPKVIMEAMTQATPVVATDVGSSRHLLNNGERGIIVPPCDAKKIADAVQRYIEDEKLRASVVNEGLKLAHLSTRNVQEEIVKTALRQYIPEICGTPSYLKNSATS